MPFSEQDFPPEPPLEISKGETVRVLGVTFRVTAVVYKDGKCTLEVEPVDGD